MYPSAHGGRSVRTTAPTGRRGPSSRTTTRGHERIAGAKTVWARICDDQQLLCLAFAFWNGNDPILKERIFGLTGDEANHGEDAKEYWWYLDSTPSHSWMRWRYAYPQAAFPYEDLIEVNGGRSRTEPEYELLDTGVFTHGWWDVEAEYAKADAGDICIRLTVRNAGSEQATLHLLPTLWFRNTWSWDRGHDQAVDHVGRRWNPAGRTRAARDGRARRRRLSAAAVLRQRDQLPPAVEHRRPRLSQGRDQRSSAERRGDRQPGRGRGPRRRCTTS